MHSEFPRAGHSVLNIENMYFERQLRVLCGSAQNQQPPVFQPREIPDPAVRPQRYRDDARVAFAYLATGSNSLSTSIATMKALASSVGARKPANNFPPETTKPSMLSPFAFVKSLVK